MQSDLLRFALIYLLVLA